MYSEAAVLLQSYKLQKVHYHVPTGIARGRWALSPPPSDYRNNGDLKEIYLGTPLFHNILA